MPGIESNGALQIMASLQKVADSQTEIARRAVVAGTSVVAKACRTASPGTVKREVGSFVKVDGDAVVGKAGLMRFPRRGQKGKGPHGVYLEHGTKFIAARHFIANAIASSRGRAAVAMENSIKRSIEAKASK
jgi:hypothetical protein